MKLKVLTKGSLSDIKVVNADTGEPVEGVQRACFEAARGEFPRIVLTIDIFEVEAESMTAFREHERRALGLPDMPEGIRAGLKRNPYQGISKELADITLIPDLQKKASESHKAP